MRIALCLLVPGCVLALDETSFSTTPAPALGTHATAALGYHAAGDVSDAPGDFAWTHLGLHAHHGLSLGETDNLLLSARWQLDDLDTTLDIPEPLHQCGISVAWRHSLGEGDFWGLGVGVGSSSDKPFASMDETDISARFFSRWAYAPGKAWLLGAYVSSAPGPLRGVPLPTAAWQYVQLAPGGPPRMWAVLGIPFCGAGGTFSEGTFDWRASTMLLLNNQARLSWHLDPTPGGWACFAEVTSTVDRWALADRSDEDERLCLGWARVAIGAGYGNGPRGGWQAEASIGYDLWRSLWVSDSLFDRDSSTDLEPAWSVLLKLSANF